MRFDAGTSMARWVMLLFVAGSVALAGCAAHRGADGRVASLATTDDVSTEAGDYDPWEPFNEQTFAFNYNLDRYIFKPVATGWTKVAPEPVRNGVANFFRNVGMPKRFVNNLLQLKVKGAVQELAGFVVNSTVGIGGLVNVMQQADLAPPDAEDTGQTLGVYGIGPGPYLVLPFFSPLTVRDAIGAAVDGLLDPVSYFIPFVGSVAKRTTITVNDRSRNLEEFEAVEESVVDLYSAVRNGYLQRRERAIME